jgi:hypothetical protein
MLASPPSATWGLSTPARCPKSVAQPLHGAITPTGSLANGDVLTVGVDLGTGVLRFSRNGVHLGDAFTGITGPLVAAVTLASEDSKVTIQNRPTVLNMGEYTGAGAAGARGGAAAGLEGARGAS